MNHKNTELAQSTQEPGGNDDSLFLQAPFTPDQVQRLNEWQTGTHGSMPVHPFTCANRSDGGHGTEGGDTGVLIATNDGWVCPHCDYTQDWAHRMMAEPQNAASLLSMLPSAWAGRMEESAREVLHTRMAGYRALAAAGLSGAETMVASLTRRMLEVEAEANDLEQRPDSW